MDLFSKIAEIPNTSGCYIFKNKYGDIIYIGKSKNLRNRVKSYFSNFDKKEGKYRKLCKEITDLEFILMEGETEALILECELIKRYKPRYNSQLIKDRAFHYLKINVNFDYPTIELAYKMKNDGSFYLSCFHSEADAENAIHVLADIWKTPSCMQSQFKTNTKACLNYHMKKCFAPCEGLISQEEYSTVINNVISFFDGNKDIFRRILLSMSQESKKHNFEKALRYKENLDALKQLQKRLQRYKTNLDNKEVFLFFRAYKEEYFTLYYIKDSIALHKMKFFKSLDDEKLHEFLYMIKADSEYSKQDKDITAYLLEVYADKYFLEIKSPMDIEKTARKIKRAFQDYERID